jgi:hypothetical protein
LNIFCCPIHDTNIDRFAPLLALGEMGGDRHYHRIGANGDLDIFFSGQKSTSGGDIASITFHGFRSPFPAWLDKDE